MDPIEEQIPFCATWVWPTPSGVELRRNATGLRSSAGSLRDLWTQLARAGWATYIALAIRASTASWPSRYCLRTSLAIRCATAVRTRGQDHFQPEPSAYLRAECCRQSGWCRLFGDGVR